MLIGASSLIGSGLLLELFESIGGGRFNKVGLVDLMSDGTPIGKFCTMVLVVGLARFLKNLCLEARWYLDDRQDW